MNKYVWFAVLVASSLVGCRTIPDYGQDPSKPQVTVDQHGRISVSPDPLLFPKEQQNVLIVWRLPQGKTFRFADKGIVIEGEITNKVVRGSTERCEPLGSQKCVVIIDQTEIVDCKPRNGGLEFTCLNRHTRPGLYKYSIQVLENGKPLDPLDPTAMNM